MSVQPSLYTYFKTGIELLILAVCEVYLVVFMRTGFEAIERGIILDVDRDRDQLRVEHVSSVPL
jgi:hypothetical protein